MRRVSVIAQDLRNDAAGDRNQKIIAAGLNPGVAGGRSTQVVAAPVIDHITPVPVFDGKAIAPAESIVWARAPFVPSRVVVLATLVATAIQPASHGVAAIGPVAGLRAFNVPAPHGI